jgi:phosphoribosylformylglycinamidine synthase
VQLFSESTARALVTVAAGDVDRLTALATRHDVPLTCLGEVTAGATLTVDGVLSVPLAELREAHESTLPRLFD